MICSHKSRYRNIEEAIDTIKELVRKYKREFRYYYCDDCNHYHITHKKKNQSDINLAPAWLFTRGRQY